MCYEFRESLAFLPRNSNPWIWISKPTESCVKKFICGRSASACPLPVERPPKDQVRRTVLVGCQAPQPVVNERGLPDTSPGNDCNDIYTRVFPCIVQKGDIFLSAKKLAPCNG